MLQYLSPAFIAKSIGEFLQAGGPVVVALSVATFVLWTLIIERLIYFATTQRWLAQDKQQRWAARPDHSSWAAHAVRERLISEQRLSNEQFMPVIRVLILVTPLLGLLGTVTGMIEVFQVITSTGASNARLMASGISKATVPTMTGLAISLSGLFLINILDRRVSRSLAALADSLDIHVQPKAATTGREA